MSPLLAGLVYFAIVYAAGFACGILRELLIVPRLGSLAGILIETPLMLAATVLAARWIVARGPAAYSLADLIWIGAVGFACLMLSEAVFSGLMRGWTITQWFGHFATTDGVISLVMFVLFGLMPLIVAGR